MSARDFNSRPPNVEPEKESPHDKKAKAVWWSILGLLAEYAFNWRRIAYFSVLLSFFLAAGLIYQSNRSPIAVYPIEIDSGTGMVKVTGPIKEGNYTPNEVVIKHFIGQFVLKVRTLPIDPVLYEQRLDEAYMFMRKNAATKMTQILKDENNMEQFKTGRIEQTITPTIVSVILATQDTYQIRWVEDVFDMNGGRKNTIHMTGLFTIEFENKSRSEKQLFINPLGIYIKDFSWSKDQKATN